ncbi:MAG: alcohol dehydrogenase catalytic domain-containing protein [Pseudomonadota bacterium]
MQAAVFKSPGQPLAIEEIEAPRLRPEGLIIEVKACGICGSDLHMAEVHDSSGGMQPLRAGAVMGHEFCGEIAEVGKGAKSDWQVGERVTALPYLACGHCYECLAGFGHRCPQARYTGMGGEAGAYAQYMQVGAAETLKLPSGVDYQFGALVEPLAVALHGVHAAQLQPGENVLVMGAGPIGIATAMWCKHFGAAHVVVSDMVPERLNIATRMGATHCINAGEENVISAYKSVASKRPDVIIECIGIPGTQQLAMDYAPAGARLVIVGVCMEPDSIVPVKALTKELQVNYVFMYRKQDFAITIDFLDRERIDPTPMITESIGFNEFPNAFESLKSDKTACKVLLKP